MIIEENHSEQGKIYEVDVEAALLEQVALLEQKKNVVQFGSGPISTMLLERERQALEAIPQAQRTAVLKDMRSKNKSANRRAKKKIADASRRRNRK